MPLRHPAKFQPDRANGLQDVRYQFFSLFGPGAKSTKREDDLLPTHVYQRAKFHRPASSHAGDIRYKSICHKQTANDIYPACLLTCGDKND